ncbi:helix-turn-helix domain-containing protein [Alkalicoccus urumqiensis]|uniref:HTH cro/C1-type domain-containing protein n=1 Tax=Alkalicoccus urumqiensis TaxID=1548213 RepID=A0A2P6MD87_ALKUR|nr:helix-turn-helix domain-containing protein [Alkalicoccus urumqiensis]PRO64251.1 hypothetical protein C6I21_15705 [Alkalicoccus urumqiensis]
MDGKRLGAKIAELRMAKGLSQRQLGKGICTQGAISQMEKGAVLPKVDTLYYLALRLDTSFAYLADVFLEPGYPDQVAFVDTIEHAARERKHDQVIEEITEFRNTHDVSRSMGYYLDWFEAISHFHSGSWAVRKTIAVLRGMLEKESDMELRRHHLHIRVMNSLAYLYAIDRNTEQSLYYYDKILESFTPPGGPIYEVDQDVFLIRVMYNKAKTLFDSGRPAEALDVIAGGIRRSIEQENMSLLGQLYHYRGECLERMGAPTEEISECYQRALLFFELLEKKQYSRLVWKHKAAYLSS